MSMTMKPIRGAMVEMGRPPVDIDKPILSLAGTHQDRPARFALNEDILSRHALFIGGTGSGKTNVMYSIVKQLRERMTSNDVMIVFDSKGDYIERLGKPTDVVIGNSAKYKDRSLLWNLFYELFADGTSEEAYKINAMEIARTLFAQRMTNTTNAFFPSAAQDVLSSLLVSICRDALSDETVRDALLNNGSLIDFLQRSSPAQLCEQLEVYPDLSAAASYIAGENEQSQGVISEMYSVIRELFIGVFAKKGNFSMRKFVRARGRRTLFLEYDLSIGSVLTPIYRLLVDLALKEALSHNDVPGEPTRNMYVICDEFKLLPHLQHIDDAVNFGRSKGVKVLAGLQSIEQLYDIYGRSKGRSVAAGFSSVFAFHANDEETMRYAGGLFGKNLILTQRVDANSAVTEEIRQGNVVEDWVISSLRVGEAVICLPFKPPFLFRFEQFRG